jgi:hypothetical protein
MLKFDEFIAEGGYNVPVVSISTEKYDLAKEPTRNEINRNIAAELSSQFVNPYNGWLKISRILEMYSIFLPKVILNDELEGEEIVAIQQFGSQWGADLTGKVTSPNQIDDNEFYLFFSYGISSSGFYECYGAIVDEEELNAILENGYEDVDYLGPEGELDPRQK